MKPINTMKKNKTRQQENYQIVQQQFLNTRIINKMKSRINNDATKNNDVQLQKKQ